MFVGQMLCIVEETMVPFTFDVRGLKCPLHNTLLRFGNIIANGNGTVAACEAGLDSSNRARSIVHGQIIAKSDD